MPTYNVILKDGGSEAEFENAKKNAVDQGGKIKHEMKLIKGFTVEMPGDKVTTLQTNDHINVEEDKEVKIQGQ